MACITKTNFGMEFTDASLNGQNGKVPDIGDDVVIPENTANIIK